MNIPAIATETSWIGFESSALVDIAKAPFVYVAAKVTEATIAFFTSTTVWVISALCLGAFVWTWYLDESLSDDSCFSPLLWQPYRIREFPPLEGPLPAPVVHYTAGCTNLGATCWLNASLNFMADTGHFDPLLNCDPDALQSPLKELVPLLKIAVNDLRSNRSPENDLLFTIREATRPYTEQTEIQNDPVDFIRGLLYDWNSNPQLPRPPTISHRGRYKPIGHDVPKPTKKAEETLLNVECYSNHLQEQFRNPSTTIDLNLAIPEMYVDDLLTDDNIKRRYCRTFSIRYDRSDRMVIGLKRFVTDDTGNRRIGNPLHINRDGTINLIDRKKVRHDYRVRAALVHEGEQLNLGHWFYVAAAADGKFYRHSDSNVREIEKGRFRSLQAAGIEELRKGTIFFLEKVPT